jgi:hypothetical protein
VVTVLESGCKFNSGYDVNKVLIPLSEWWCECGGGTFRKLIIHPDNARPHKVTISQQFIAENGMRMAIHRHDSPDLAPFDSYMFGRVKSLLRGEPFETGEDLLSAIHVILGNLEMSILSRVFLEWMTRLEQCVETNGDDVG